ncbi:MAG TPA: hypothetical protein VKU60_00905, partial [Chloroflexota bacterium]|nr:hypothetical protein [Chloroflexota bacterium]
DAARKEGRLVLVWGEGAVGGSEGARRLADGLNKHNGLNIEAQFTPGPAMPDMGINIQTLQAAGVKFHEVDINFVQRNDEKHISEVRQQLQNILAKK